MVAHSSAEAEYRAMASVACEFEWFLSLLKSFGINLGGPAVLYRDNEATLHVAANSIYHKCTKHTELDCHFVHEKVQGGTIKTFHASTQHQIAYWLTKPLHPRQLKCLLDKMGVLNLHVPS